MITELGDGITAGPAVLDGSAAGWGFGDLPPYFKRTETALGRDPAPPA